MKKVMLLAFIFTIFNTASAIEDSISVKINKDTVIIRDYAIQENCGSKFIFEISTNRDTILITERDTSMVWFRCNCDFNLYTTITGLQKGKYYVKVFRKYDLHPEYPVRFIGDAEFDFTPASMPGYSARGYQSECLTAMDIKPIKPDMGLKLYSNYPNPFNPSTVISFEIEAQNSALVQLKIYDILGRNIKTLVDEYKNPGTYTVIFDAKGLASGTYLYKLSANGRREVKKMMVIR